MDSTTFGNCVNFLPWPFRALMKRKVRYTEDLERTVFSRLFHLLITDTCTPVSGYTSTGLVTFMLSCHEEEVEQHLLKTTNVQLRRHEHKERGIQHTERSVEVEQARGLTQRGTRQKPSMLHPFHRPESDGGLCSLLRAPLLTAWPHKKQQRWTRLFVRSQLHCGTRFASSLHLTLAVRKTWSFSSPPHL